MGVNRAWHLITWQDTVDGGYYQMLLFAASIDNSGDRMRVVKIEKITNEEAGEWVNEQYEMYGVEPRRVDMTGEPVIRG